jgi:rubrerythrin
MEQEQTNRGYKPSRLGGAIAQKMAQEEGTVTGYLLSFYKLDSHDPVSPNRHIADRPRYSSLH